MVDKLSDGIVSAYKSFMNKSHDEKGKSHDYERMPITQTRALQLLFDVKFITGVLPKKEQPDVRYFNVLPLMVVPLKFIPKVKFKREWENYV